MAVSDANQILENVVFGEFGLSVAEFDYQCDKHGAYKGRKCKSPRTGQVIEPKCPACTEDAERERMARDQREARQQFLARSIERAGIPKRFQSKRLADYLPTTPAQQHALKICAEFAENFEDALSAGRCMIFCGKAGTGKTHLSTAIANHVILNGRTAIFSSVREIVGAVKATWRKGADKTEQQALEPFCMVDLLVIDEVGVQFDSEAEKLVMFDVINRRYNEMKPMIVISNLPMDSTDSPSIKSVLGDRIIDRLRENGGKLIRFDWESHRGAA